MTHRRMSLKVGRKVTRSARLLSYGIALFSTALALGITLLFAPLIDPIPKSLFFLAVMVSAWYGGLGPGLVATVLSTLAINYCFVPPLSSLKIAEPGSIIRLGVFVMAALLIGGLNESRRTALHREQRLRAASEAAQSEAQAAKECLEKVLSSISDGFYTLDRDWRYTYVNDRYCEMAGMQREDLLGRNVWELFPDAVDTDIYVQFQRAMSEQTSLQFEYLYATWNRWYEHRVYPSPNGLTVFIAEITDAKHREAERKQTEEALRQSEERLRIALKNSPITLYTQDRELRYTWVYNPTPEFADVELIGKHDADLLAAEEAEILTQIKRRVLETGIGTRAEIETTGKGRTLYHDLTVEPLRNADGKILGITCAAVNITRLKQTELALRQSEERFRVSQELSLDAFTILDSVRDETGAIVDFVWMYANPKAAEILQHPVDELVGQRLLEVLPGNQTNSELFERYVRVVETGEPHDIELSYNADGITGWFRNMTVKLEDGVAIFFSDISARKQAEEALRLSESRYRTLAHAVAQLMWVNDANGNMQFYNQQWQEYTGVVDLELGIGLWVDIIHPDDFQTTLETRTKAIQAGEAYEVECRLKRADRTYRWHLARVVPFKDDRGQILYWFGTATDIEDRKRAEAEREQLLAREQAAREAAEAANRIKDEFLAVVSHELRSPLNPILGWSRLLQDGKLDEARTKQALATIERNAKLQAELIEDLLDISRILRGKLSLTVSPIILASTIKAAIETVRLAAEAKSIRIETMLDPEIGLVLGDSTRLQQVVWNLLSNAIKFTPAGGRVEIRLSSVTSHSSLVETDKSQRTNDKRLMTNNKFAQITVSDTGKGISPDFLPHVFDYFRQEDSATTRKFGGLGLGLAIVRHLVELHGGTIQADSPGEGLGATFTVRLPLMPAQPTFNQDSQLLEPALDLNGIQVLVVDDDTDTRDFVAFLLEQAGASVITATSAREALTALTKSQPDVLVSDIGMPEMNGYMLLRQIRALPPQQGGQIPAIALTAYAGEFDRRQALSVGFQKHVSKPVEPERLVRAIVTILRQTASS
ncbi:PAS domain-containing protein [Pleurocapsales cyanobacterium LEGE 06147]|nr:PAS domain-containing protein [Pleurocapsales cyanobacterium LEGE 06147]